MKKLVFIFLILIPRILYSQVSIHDIQYTTNAGTNSTYPSPYEGQVVNTGGIVTATGFSGGRYFISSSAGGAWSGIYIYDNTNSPSVGDSIVITGQVYEYNGLTELKSLTAFEIISSSNPLPPPAQISTAQVTEEAYEGVFVEINNCTVTSLYDAYGNWAVNDGSGECTLRDGIFNLQDAGFPLFNGYPFLSIKGIITDYYGSSLQVRGLDDIQSEAGAFILSSPVKEVFSDQQFSYPIKLSILNQTENITSYSLNIQYDPSVLQYNGFDQTGTISETGTVIDQPTTGNIVLNYSGTTQCNGIDTAISLKFLPLNKGNANLQFNTSTINGSDITYYSAGVIENFVGDCDLPIGDTLTVVQRPLFNIPSIVTPGDDLKIQCFAPESTTGWDAQLIFNGHNVDLNISQAAYDQNLEKWTLTATIPDVDFYELFDLRVTADGGLLDDVSKCVKVIDSFKDDYYFVHITDAHLPTHYFYEDQEGITDTSELNDMYEVIKDINLIQPEFVLFTGDIINEGELEDFECRRNHTRSIELLKRFQVPVYIVPGNHDLGGWDLTPPPQGTARREWWRFFGWRQKEIPPVETAYQSHDYSFNYGNVHFTGLEAYDNYDNYMYDVYGSTSFTSSQLAWLTNDLAAAGNKTKVLFYHYDFKNELNLTNLGVDMALWGHIHRDDGSINSYPYNLATDNICDGARAYRVIRANNGDLQPQNTIYTHSGSENLYIEYHMVNDGSLDSLSATIYNNHNQSFNNGIVRFKMPVSDYGYTVTNGKLEQVVAEQSYVICYVRATIPSNNQIRVSIKRNMSEVTGVMHMKQGILEQNYPNPFAESTQIHFNVTERGKVSIVIYDASGRKVKTLVSNEKLPGSYAVYWDGTNTAGSKVENGVYFYKLTVNNRIINSRQMIFMR